jgi:hypothetical protein
MYLMGNQRLLLRLLRSIVSSSFDNVMPSSVKRVPCLPTVSAKAGPGLQAR